MNQLSRPWEGFGPPLQSLDQNLDKFGFPSSRTLQHHQRTDILRPAGALLKERRQLDESKRLPAGRGV